MSGDHQYFGTAPGHPYVSPDGIVEQGVTEIDVDSVATAVSWLDGLKSYVQTHLVPDTAKMIITQSDTELWFGGLDSTSQVAGLHSTYVKAMIDSYRAIADSLGTASRVTAEIVKNYKDVEHNNTLTATNIDAAWASAASNDSSTAPGADPPPSTGASTTAGDNVDAKRGSFE